MPPYGREVTRCDVRKGMKLTLMLHGGPIVVFLVL